MRTLFSKIKDSALLRALLCLAMGLLLWLNPTVVPRWMLYILAGYCAVLGVLALAAHFSDAQKADASGYDFVIGVLMILLSAILIVYQSQIANIIHIFIGMMIALNGTSYFIQSRDMHRMKQGAGMPMLVYSLVLMALGAFVIFKPFAAQIMLFRFYGFILAVMGVGEFVWFFVWRRLRK